MLERRLCFSRVAMRATSTTLKLPKKASMSPRANAQGSWRRVAAPGSVLRQSAARKSVEPLTASSQKAVCLAAQTASMGRRAARSAV